MTKIRFTYWHFVCFVLFTGYKMTWQYRQNIRSTSKSHFISHWTLNNNCPWHLPWLRFQPIDGTCTNKMINYCNESEIKISFANCQHKQIYVYYAQRMLQMNNLKTISSYQEIRSQNKRNYSVYNFFSIHAFFSFEWHIIEHSLMEFFEFQWNQMIFEHCCQFIETLNRLCPMPISVTWLHSVDESTQLLLGQGQ